MEPPFDKLDGVVSTISGYIGGHKANPSYEEVSAGITGHTEAVQITYDPATVSYERLLGVFWRNVDPLDAGDLAGVAHRVDEACVSAARDDHETAVAQVRHQCLIVPHQGVRLPLAVAKSLLHGHSPLELRGAFDLPGE